MEWKGVERREVFNLFSYSMLYTAATLQLATLVLVNKEACVTNALLIIGKEFVVGASELWFGAVQHLLKVYAA